MDMATGCHSSRRRRKRATTCLWATPSPDRAGITCAIVSPCRVIATVSPRSTVRRSSAKRALASVACTVRMGHIPTSQYNQIECITHCLIYATRSKPRFSTWGDPTGIVSTHEMTPARAVACRVVFENQATMSLPRDGAVSSILSFETTSAGWPWKSPGVTLSWADTDGAAAATNPIQSQAGENDRVHRLSMLAEYREASQ